MSQSNSNNKTKIKWSKRFDPSLKGVMSEIAFMHWTMDDNLNDEPLTFEYFWVGLKSSDVAQVKH